MSLTTPFLTELDERARVRGSRDPLGAQPLWSVFGRGLIGNLSTVSNSVRDFKVLLLGYWFVGQIAPLEDAKGSLEVFLRWEQLASFARFSQGDARFRGTDRVQKVWADDNDSIRISADSSGQILSDQPRYGLWGLFSVPAQSSGLIEGSPRRLSPAALEFVEKHYRPMFDATRVSHTSGLLEGLARPRWFVDRTGGRPTLFEALGKILVAPLSGTERVFYREHLLMGGPRNDQRAVQEVFAEVLSERLELVGGAWTPSLLESLARQCDRCGDAGRMAASRVREILACESVLAPAAALFDHLLAHHEQSWDDVLANVRHRWGARLRSVRADDFASLRLRVRQGSATDTVAQHWQRIAAALAEGDFEAAARELLKLNAEIALLRGGAPWVTLERGTLRVMLRDGESADLPARSELAEFWRHAYFLASLRDVARELKGGDRS